MEKEHTALIIIPAFNEEQSLPLLLDTLKANQHLGKDTDILVVDDGSRDNTALVAKQRNVKVLTLPINSGVGAAMQAGFLYATRNGYGYALQVDADGQHPAEAIPSLLSKIKNEGYDLVIGARFAEKGSYQVKGPRAWAMWLLSKIFTRLLKTKITDATSGFKCYSRKAFAHFSHRYPPYYLGDTIEALVIAAKANFKVTQLPVEMEKRKAGIPSHKPLKSAIYLLRAMSALMIALTKNERKYL